MTQKDTLSGQVKSQEERIQELTKETALLQERAHKAEQELTI